MDEQNSQFNNPDMEQKPQHHVNSRAIIMVIVLFALIVAGMFVFAFLKKSELQDAVIEDPVPIEEPSPYAGIDRIDAKHFFIDGTHTIAGEIAMPTPCDLLNPEVSIAESFPEQVTVNFDVINNSDSCAQTITNQRFKVDFEASEDASIRAQLDGRDVELNLIPAAEGETPDDFELFIKG